MTSPAPKSTGTIAAPTGARYARIMGVGGYRPERVVPNSEIIEAIDSSDEWIQERSGIKERRFAAKDESVVDMAEAATRDALEASGLADDTVIAYTADHGEMLGKFGVWWKSMLYEDAARIPMIAAGPGFGSGIRVETPVSLLDLQASIFHAVEKTRPAAWWGEPLQRIPVSDSRRVAFSEYHAHGVPSGAFMIRRGDWKLIYDTTAPHQLFNLREDPEELRNVWSTEPEIARDLERELRKICDPEAVNAAAHAFERRQLERIAEIKERG